MTRLVTAIALFAAAFAAPVAAQQGDTPVTSTLADADASVAPILQIRSDTAGPYVHRPRYLSSVIQSIGDWELDLGIITRLSGRTAYLDFSRPLAGTGAGGGEPIALPSQRYVVRFITKCYSVGNDLYFIPVGQRVICPVIVRFDDYNGNQYRLQMNTSAYGDTDNVAIACLAPGSDGRCARWHLTPSGTYADVDGTVHLANTAKLVKLVTRKGSTTEVNQGHFLFSFSIDVAR